MSISDNPTFKEWVLELLKDERGGVSIKPVITLIGSLVLFTSMFLSAWVPGFAPSDALINAIMIITGVGMGADTMDKFSYRPKYNFDEEDNRGPVNYNNPVIVNTNSNSNSTMNNPKDGEGD